MPQYYVIRNKDTGFYFRGKGENRWGEHFNQASIYRIRKKAEKAVKKVSWRGEQAEIVPIQIIESTADVVEVVRCKDCAHSSTTRMCDVNEFWCGVLCTYTCGDGYCERGERKEQT